MGMCPPLRRQLCADPNAADVEPPEDSAADEPMGDPLGADFSVPDEGPEALHKCTLLAAWSQLAKEWTFPSKENRPLSLGPWLKARSQVVPRAEWFKSMRKGTSPLPCYLQIGVLYVVTCARTIEHARCPAATLFQTPSPIFPCIALD
eukprot:4271725-Amphidinium_carterae.2